VCTGLFCCVYRPLLLCIQASFSVYSIQASFAVYIGLFCCVYRPLLRRIGPDLLTVIGAHYPHCPHHLACADCADYADYPDYATPAGCTVFSYYRMCSLTIECVLLL
jgi:hypothetical protein